MPTKIVERVLNMPVARRESFVLIIVASESEYKISPFNWPPSRCEW